MLSVGCPVEILMWYNFMRKENEPFVICVIYCEQKTKTLAW